MRAIPLIPGSSNEGQVKETLDLIWDKPSEGRRIIARLSGENVQLFEFEKMMEAAA